jgi:hypothetical protein
MDSSRNSIISFVESQLKTRFCPQFVHKSTQVFGTEVSAELLDDRYFMLLFYAASCLFNQLKLHKSHIWRRKIFTQVFTVYMHSPPGGAEAGAHIPGYNQKIYQKQILCSKAQATPFMHAQNGAQEASGHIPKTR